MALVGAGAWFSVIGRSLARHLGDHLVEIVTQRGAVGRRRRTLASARIDDAVQPRVDELAGEDLRLPPELDYECTARAGRLDLLQVGRRQPVHGRRDQIMEDPRRAHDLGGLWIVKRNPDHLDPEQGGVGVLAGHAAGAAGQFFGGAHRSRAGDVDVDVVVVARMLEHGVGVRTPAGLHVGHVLRVGDIRDVEDADAAQTVVAHSLLHALVTAVEPSAESLAGHEQQVVVHRDIALRGRASVRDHRRRIRRIGDVPDLDAVVVALNGVVAREGEVGVGFPHEGLLGWRGGHQTQVPDRLAGVEEAGREADPGVGGGRVDVETGGGVEGRRRDGSQVGGHARAAFRSRGTACQRDEGGGERQETRERHAGEGEWSHRVDPGHKGFLVRGRLPAPQGQLHALFRWSQDFWNKHTGCGDNGFPDSVTCAPERQLRVTGSDAGMTIRRK